MDILSRGQERTKPGISEWIALLIYTALVVWEELHHVPWADEAQAWLIARDSTLAQLFLNRLHYEATPGLWHILLWAFARLHGSYSGLHWLAAAIGVLTAWVILRYSPFSLPIRILLPLGFSFVLQTAVIARSYNLVPLLAFILCMLLGSRHSRPITFAIVAGLLANTALFSALMSAGFVAAYMIVAVKRRSTATAARISPARWAASGVTVLLLWVAAAWTALPAPDLSYGMGPQLSSHPGYVRMVSRITGIAIPPAQNSASSPSFTLSLRPGSTPIQRKIWDYFKGPDHHTVMGHLVTQAVLALSIAFYPVSQFSVLAAVFYILWVAWAIRQKVLWSLLPFAATFAGARFLGYNEHHILLLWTSLVASLWMALNVENHKENADQPHILKNALGAALLLIAFEQVCWTASALRLEANMPFDGSRQAAEFIQSKVIPQPIAGFDFYSVAVDAYFRDVVFFNQRSAFWPWSRVRDPDLELPAILAKKPRFVVLGESHTGQSLMLNQIIPIFEPGNRNTPTSTATYLAAHGYRQTHQFCGLQPAHFSYSEKVCEQIWETDATTPMPRE